MMIWNDSDLIFLFLSLTSVIALSVNVEAINRCPPPLRQGTLKAAVDVWRLATGGRIMWDPEGQG